ncbi:MAG TPA: prepilin-type N-terminal cleavage/methylation domain-containing protein [Gemmatimonadota bacterium]
MRRSGRLHRCETLRRPAASRRARRTRRRGFTLIEMMVAILLLGVGMMALAALTTTVTRANVQSSSRTVASSLAQERIERFRTEPYALIVAGNDARVVDGVTYTRTWTVATNDPAPGLKTVSVTVSWTTRGKLHSSVLATILSAR